MSPRVPKGRRINTEAKTVAYEKSECQNKSSCLRTEDGTYTEGTVEKTGLDEEGHYPAH